VDKNMYFYNLNEFSIRFVKYVVDFCIPYLCSKCIYYGKVVPLLLKLQFIRQYHLFLLDNFLFYCQSSLYYSLPYFTQALFLMTRIGSCGFLLNSYSHIFRYKIWVECTWNWVSKLGALG